MVAAPYKSKKGYSIFAVALFFMFYTEDRVGIIGLRLLFLPHHRIYGFQYLAVESENGYALNKSSATSNPYCLSRLLFITLCVVGNFAILHALRDCLANFKAFPFTPNRFRALYRPFRLCQCNQKHFLICRRVYPLT